MKPGICNSFLNNCFLMLSSKRRFSNPTFQNSCSNPYFWGVKTLFSKFGFKTDIENPKLEKPNFWSFLKYLAARNFMLSGTDSKNALFLRMAKGNHDELEAFMLSFYHHHWYFEAKNWFDGSYMDFFVSEVIAKNTGGVFRVF